MTTFAGAIAPSNFATSTKDAVVLTGFLLPGSSDRAHPDHPIR